MNNSYINEKTCGNPENNRNRKYHTYWRLTIHLVLNMLKRVGTEKVIYQKYICHWQKDKELVYHVSCEPGHENTTTLCMF